DALPIFLAPGGEFPGDETRRDLGHQACAVARAVGGLGPAMVEPVQALDSETRQVIGGLKVSRGDEPDATGVVFLPSVDAGPRHVPSGGKPGMLGEPGRGPYKGSRSGGERSGEVLDRLAEAPAEGGRDHREEHRGQEAVDLDHDLYGEQRAVTFRLDVDTDRP